MPAFTFSGLVATVYPFDRDATGQPLGEVQPGDVRDLDKALDWQWVAVEPGGDGSGGGGQGDENPPDGNQSPTPPSEPQAIQQPAEQATQPPAPSPAPVPAPPAVVPPGGAFAVTADQQ